MGRLQGKVFHLAELILQPFRHFTYVTAHSPTLPSLYLRHNSLSNSSVASPTSQLIVQPFFRLSYITAHSDSPRFPSQLILQPFRRFTYVKAHSPTFPSLHLRHNPFSNPCVALAELILQPFRHLTYVTTHSPTLP